MSSNKITMLAAAAALIGKPLVDDEQGVTELAALQQELPRLRQYAADVGKELGETDPAKAVAKVRALAASVAQHEQDAKAAKAAAIKTAVEAKMKEYEKKLTVPMRSLLAAQLTRELEAGVKLEETETVKALTSLPTLGIVGRDSGVDTGGEGAGDMDERLDREAKSLLATDPELIALAKTDYNKALDRAQDIAAKKIGYKSEQMERVRLS